LEIQRELILLRKNACYRLFDNPPVWAANFTQFPPNGGGNQTKGFFMKNKFKIFGIIALIAVMVSVSGCAILSSVGGTADPHGLISQAKVASEGAVEIASYSVILGLIDAGYKEYDAKVKAAEASGKQITTVTTFLFVLTKTTAYAR
jgi:hypothetical protein